MLGACPIFYPLGMVVLLPTLVTCGANGGALGGGDGGEGIKLYEGTATTLAIPIGNIVTCVIV